MQLITAAELDRISAGILEDRDVIIRHNPIGSEDEILLWMLLNCLVSYLSLTDTETPCFNGKPDAQTYFDAIRMVLKHHKDIPFDESQYLLRLAPNLDPAGRN